MFKGNRIIITGGGGFLGSKIVEKLADKNYLTIYSRDEAKHYFLKKRFPNIKCVIGDVADFDSLNLACRGNNVGIFCAALKQIEAVEQNPLAGLNTIALGAINSKRAAIENKFLSACMISTDKSSAPQTSYGALKMFSENVFVNNNENVSTFFSACRYGNVAASKGSIIELIWQAIKHKYILSLYDEEMTRFNITSDGAIDLIFESLQQNSCVVIPKITSFRVADLFNIYAEKFGLMFKEGQPRPNEKIHELLFSQEESRRIFFDRNKNLFLLTNKNNLGSEFYGKEYSSADYCVSKQELEEFLAKNNYYEPIR